MQKIDYKKISQNILSNLSKRQKEVLERRFGLDGYKQETLQQIGMDFGVTRERIRQIEREAFLKLRKKEDKLRIVFNHFIDYLNKNGGQKREDLLIKDLAEDQKAYIYFLLCIGSVFFRQKEDNDVHSFWSNTKDAKEKLDKEVFPLIQELKKKNKPVEEKYVFQLVSASSLEITRRIEKGPLGNFGLSFWPEINPKGVRDTAYLVLKKTEQPIHFREIASRSNQLYAQTKKVLPQTVHNELIRDPRFVLVGRGIYALKEWGYDSGTVKDVILNTLKKSKKPLSKNEILNAVKKQRIVKDNTIFLNLSDKTSFKRNLDGKYVIRMA